MSRTTFDRIGLGTWSLGTALFALGALAVVLLAGGGAPEPSPPGLPDAGSITGWGIPVLRLLADLAGFAAVGMALTLTVLRSHEAAAGHARTVKALTVTTAVWMVVVSLQIPWTQSLRAAQPLPSVLSPGTLLEFAAGTATGRTLLAQMVLTAGAVVLSPSAVRRLPATLVLTLTLAALIPTALTGHTATSEGRVIAIPSIIVHVLALSMWVGGLAGLMWSAIGRPAGLVQVLPRFSRLALGCFIAVGLSGMVTAAVQLSSFESLWTTSYGVLVLAKVCALVVLGCFGRWQRRTVMAQLALRQNNALAAFMAVALVELAVMAATAALAVGLSRTPTPASDQTTSVENAATAPTPIYYGSPLPPLRLIVWTTQDTREVPTDHLVSRVDLFRSLSLLRNAPRATCDFG